MGYFGDIGLAYAFSLIFGCLIALTLIAACIRLYRKKRKLARDTLKHDLEAAEKATQKALAPERDLGEGDLFGVRAIEKGFYGGVTQSTCSTAANSPQSSPTIAASYRSPIVDGTLVESSILDDFSSLEVGETQVGSHSRSQSLRLQPSDAELSGRRNHDPSLIMSSYMPPLSQGAGASNDTVSASEIIIVSQPNLPLNFNPQVQSYAQCRLSQANKGNVKSILRSDSQFPKFYYKPKSVYVSCGTNTESQTHVPSQSPSIHSNNERHPGVSTQSRASRRRSRSVSTFNYHRQLYPPQDMPISLVHFLAPPPIPPRNPSRQGRSTEIGDSSSDTDSQRRNLKHSQSAKDSVKESSLYNSRRRSRSQPVKGDHHRLTSSISDKSLRNVRDSLRHSREACSDTVGERRISRQRDTIHYDPRPLHRSVSGVVVGRSVNFDHPRSSPFESLNKMFQTTSPELSSSSSSSAGSFSRSRSHQRSIRHRDRAKNLSLEYTHWMMRSNIIGDVREYRSSHRY